MAIGEDPNSAPGLSLPGLSAGDVPKPIGGLSALSDLSVIMGDVPNPAVIGEVPKPAVIGDVPKPVEPLTRGEVPNPGGGLEEPRDPVEGESPTPKPVPGC